MFDRKLKLLNMALLLKNPQDHLSIATQNNCPRLGLDEF